MIPQFILKKTILPFILKELAKYLNYVDKPNELDLAVKRIDKTMESVETGHEAMKNVFKGVQEQIDLVNSEITNIKTSVSGFTKLFNKLKNISLLKSVFK